MILGVLIEVALPKHFNSARRDVGPYQTSSHSPEPTFILIRTPYILYPISYILAAAFFSQRRLRYSVNPISAHKIPAATYTFGSGIAVM